MLSSLFFVLLFCFVIYSLLFSSPLKVREPKIPSLTELGICPFITTPEAIYDDVYMDINLNFTIMIVFLSWT